MNLDVKISSKGIIETIRDHIAELENRETSGVANADTCEMLVDLHDLLDKIYSILMEYSRKTFQ